MSRRLTANEKSKLLEYCTDDYMYNAVKHLINTDETKDFNEGVVSGLLLAIEIIQKTNHLDRLSIIAINAVIQETLKLL